MYPEALAANVIIDRYRQLKAEQREHPERAAQLEPMVEQLRQQWKTYNGDDDLAEVANGEDEAA